jgi:hypothetical protein
LCKEKIQFNAEFKNSINDYCLKIALLGIMVHECNPKCEDVEIKG